MPGIYKNRRSAVMPRQSPRVAGQVSLPMAVVLLCRDIMRILGHERMVWTLAAYAAAAGALVAAALYFIQPLDVAILLSVGLLLFLPTEYVVHRFVLHPLIYLDSRILARIWIRAHYAHHRSPGRSDVVLASPGSVILLVLATNGPVALIAGPEAVLAGAAALLLPFAFFYEFVHFGSHLPVRFESAYFRRRRKLHLLHHFHNDKCNYGICSSVFDRLGRTHAKGQHAVERSATARNLGYDEAIAKLKPLVRMEYERSLPGG